MFALKELTLILLCIVLSEADKPTHEHHRSTLAKNLENLRNQHREEIAMLKEEMIQLRKEFHTHCVAHPIRHGSIQERNMKLSIEETQQELSEIRAQVSEANETPKANVTDVHKHLQAMKRNMNRIISENNRHASHVRILEARIEKMDGVMQRLRYDKKIIESTLGELRSQLSSISKQVKHKILELEEEANGVSNNVEEATQEARKHRHVKILHTQLQRLSRAHDQLEMGHQSIQVQLSAHQSRLDRLEKPNWDVISAKLDYLDIQTKSINNRLANNTPSSDVNKMHGSILELREDLEAVENKMDKVTPEFRKEISKLDIDQAQLNAHFSYVKQDVENLRQSVRAIAVSMSNTQDRAAQNRDQVKRVTDAVETLTAQAKNHFYRLNDYILKSEANPAAAETNLTEIITLPELMGEVKELQPVEREYQDLVAQLPKDCSNVTEPPGIYIIRPGQDTVNAWCANGTTLIQRRFNGSVEFNHLFPEYVQGFGDLTSEYWMGLETMHRLTVNNCSSMRIDMTDIFGAAWYAEYESFYVGGAETGYVLRVSGFRGNASDAFEYQNHMEFSTIDRDRDISNTHCAANYEGGWWFSHCQHVNINGKYTLGLTWFDSTHNEWIAVATSEMRVFRRPGCF